MLLSRPSRASVAFSSTERVKISPESLRDSGIRASRREPPARSAPQGGAAERDISPRDRLGAVDRARQLGASGPDEPCQPDDLAGAHVDRRIGDAGGREAANGEDDRRVRRRRFLRRKRRGERAAEHRLDQRALGRLRRGELLHHAPVPQDGDRLREGEHLP